MTRSVSGSRPPEAPSIYAVTDESRDEFRQIATRGDDNDDDNRDYIDERKRGISGGGGGEREGGAVLRSHFRRGHHGRAPL